MTAITGGSTAAGVSYCLYTRTILIGRSCDLAGNGAPRKITRVFDPKLLRRIRLGSDESNTRAAWLVFSRMVSRSRGGMPTTTAFCSGVTSGGGGLQPIFGKSKQKGLFRFSFEFAGHDFSDCPPKDILVKLPLIFREAALQPVLSHRKGERKVYPNLEDGCQKVLNSFESDLMKRLAHRGHEKGVWDFGRYSADEKYLS